MPAAADIQAEVSADITPFTKGLAQGVTASQDFGTKVLGVLIKVEKGLDVVGNASELLSGRFGTIAKGVAGFVVAGKSLDAIGTSFQTIKGAIAGIAGAGFDFLKGEVDQLVELGRSADAAGLTTDAYQELAYAAARAGVSQNEFRDSIKTAAEQVFLARNGVGDLTEVLGRYNPRALEAVKGSRTLTDAVLGIANAVRDAAGEQERAAITTTAFGHASDTLRRFLTGGASAIEESIAKAREFGIVMDEAMIRKAPEIQDKFAAVANIIAVQFQGAVVSASPAVIGLAGALADLLQNVTPLIDRFARLTAGIGAAFASNDLGANSLSVLNIKLRETDAEIARVTERLNGIGADDPMRGTRAEQFVMQKLADLQTQRGSIQDEIARRGWQSAIESNPNFKLPSTQGGGEDAAGDNGASERAREGAQRQLETIHDQMLAATKQTSELIQAEYDKQLAKLEENLQKGLIDYGDYTKGRAELEETLTAKLAIEAQKQVQPIANALKGTLENAFDDLLQTGKMNWDAWRDYAISAIAKVAFQMAVIQPLFGGGGTSGGGIIGTALASVFHGGGTVGQGGGVRAMPGLAFAQAPRFHSGGFAGLRSGEVPAILERGEQVIPKGGRMAGGGRPIIFQVTTPDADSFRRSEGQIAAMLTRATQRGQRNL